MALYKVDNQYLFQSDFTEAKERADNLKRVLQRYTYDGFLNLSVLNLLRENWSYLNALWPNTRYTTLYRGFTFAAKDFRKFLKFVLHIGSRGFIKSDQIRSWSYSRVYANDFGWHYYKGSATVLNSLNGFIVLKTILPNNLGIDLDSALGKSEKEILLPPGAYPISFASLGFVDFVDPIQATYGNESSTWRYYNTALIEDSDLILRVFSDNWSADSLYIDREYNEDMKLVKYRSAKSLLQVLQSLSDEHINALKNKD